MKTGSINIVTIIAPNPPTHTILITSFARPCNTILCPGRIDVAVPSSGTPKSIEGTNSINACAIDIATISTQRNSGLKKVNKNPNDETIKTEFAKWNRSGGKVLAGLTRRRKAESDLYFTPYIVEKPKENKNVTPVTEEKEVKTEPKPEVKKTKKSILGWFKSLK